jgi:hypothetical protein
MANSLTQTVLSVNSRLAAILLDMQRSLRGESSFTDDDVRALRSLLAEMEPVIARSAEWRKNHPEFAAQLDLYKSQLLELQKTTEQLRVALLVQRATLEARRERVHAASRWCSAYRQTQ